MIIAFVKSVASKTWGVLKNYVFPSYAATTQFASGIGQVFFVVPRFIKYIANTEKTPYTMPAIIIDSVGVFITLLFSRTHSLFPKLRDQNAGAEIPVESIRGKIFVGGSRAIASVNAGLGGLGNYLFAIVFVQTIVNAVNSAERSEAKIEKDNAMLTALWSVQALAISFYLSKVICNYAFTQGRVHLNAQKVAHHFETSEHIFDIDKRALAVTILGTFAGAIPLPYYAYFTMSNGLTRIPFVAIPEEVNHIISGIAAVSTAYVYFMTGPFSLYNVLKKKKTTSPATCAEKPVIVVTYAGLGVDTLGTAAGNFTAFVTTTERVFGINQKNYYIIGAGIITSTSAALLNFFMNTDASRELLKKMRLGSTPSDEPAPTEVKKPDESSPLLEKPSQPIAVPTHPRIGINVHVSRHHATLHGNTVIDIQLTVPTDEEVFFHMDMDLPKQPSTPQ